MLTHFTLLAWLYLGGCGNGASEPEPEDPCLTARRLRGGSTSFLTVAEEADITARVLPGGFGGMFQALGSLGSGSLVVYLKDLSQRDEAAKVLSQVLSCGAVYPGWLGVAVSLNAVEFRMGQFTGTELLSYLRAVEPLRNDPDVWALELDPELNAIWIGLRDGSAELRIKQSVAAAQVPTNAVAIEVPPPPSGAEPFETLNSPVLAQEEPGLPGLFGLHLQVRYGNTSTETRYPDQCVSADVNTLYSYFLHTLERWDGRQWVRVHSPICRLILLPPRPVAPGAQQTDSVPVSGSRRLNVQPVWLSARVTGTYRFVGEVYRSTTSTPPFLTDPVPLEERVSAPFQLVRSAPF